MSVLDWDATQLALKLKQGELSSEKAVDTYIAHLERLNPSICCLVEERYRAAREEAQRCDEQLRSGTNVSGRLFGVPISMKEAFDVSGMKTTGGLIQRQEMVADHDAAIVAKLKKEGAIILGKTNTPTLCFCQETDNKLYGRTNNPWNVQCTAGGSSGGEGALIAAGGAAVGIGSDIGGSIRFPAHFNGIIGFKSGAEQVSGEGSYPPFEHPLQARMLGIGAMAKSVEDARLINDILAFTAPPQRNLSNFTIVMPRQTVHYPVSSETLKLLAQIEQVLQEEEGLANTIQVLDEQPPMYHDSALLWQLIMSIDGAQHISSEAFGEGKSPYLKEWVKERLQGTSQWHHYLTWALIGANTFKPSSKKLRYIQEQINRGDEQVQSYLTDKLLILPVYHAPALAHGQVYKELFSIRRSFLSYIPFVAYANVWGLPSLTVPVGEEGGLPIGVQIISCVGNEDAIFKLGEWLENQFRGWKRAPI